jgi:hypothetical protein
MGISPDKLQIADQCVRMKDKSDSIFDESLSILFQ